MKRVEDSAADIVRFNPGSRYSQGVIHGGLLYTAGLVDGNSGEVAEQTRSILSKIDALLAAAGTTKARILSVSIWLSDIGTFDEMNSVWEQWIDRDHLPARATVESKLAAPEYKVEISVIAATDDR
jgi:enamine deaminase RidA (YjgF/YER057c/UK114 family)